MKKNIITIICSGLIAWTASATQPQQEKLKILSVKPKSIYDNSTRINISLNQPAQAQIEYGPTAQYGLRSAKEKSFKYQQHSMLIRDLKPLTRYHYRVHVWDRQGNEVVSKDYSLVTAKPAPPHPWASKWEYNYRQILIKAQQQHKPVLVLFSGSDWCPICIRFEKQVLDSKEFQDYLAKNYLLLLIDFPRHRNLSSAQFRQNHALYKKYAIRGIPTLLILDATGKVIGRSGAKSSSKKQIAALTKSINHYKQLKAAENKRSQHHNL